MKLKPVDRQAIFEQKKDNARQLASRLLKMVDELVEEGCPAEAKKLDNSLKKLKALLYR